MTNHLTELVATDIPIEAAQAQMEALIEAESRSPLRQYRLVLLGQIEEWDTAIKMWNHAGGEAVIELAGTVMPSMRIGWFNRFDELEFPRILRVTRGAGLSFQLDVPDESRAVYVGFGYPVSPVVVQR